MASLGRGVGRERLPACRDRRRAPGRWPGCRRQLPSISTAPWWNTVTVLAMRRMNCMSCSTTTRAWRRFSSAISPTRRSTSSSVMPAAGSSSRMRSGSGAITMASSTSWRWPCASCPTRRWAMPPMPTRSIAASVRLSAMLPRRNLVGRDPDILARAQAVEDVGHLGLDADAAAGDGMGRVAGHRFAAEQHVAAARPVAGPSGT